MRVTGIAVITALLAACGGASASQPAQPAPELPPWVDGPSGRLRVDDGGAGGGVPVVFVHGLAANHHVWDAALAHERASRRALALDLHGFGESAPSSTGDYSIASMAGDVAAVVDARGLERFVLVGHSMGGLVAVAYAGQHPDRVAGLVLVDSAPDLHEVPSEALQGITDNLSAEKYDAFSVQFYGEMLEGGTQATKDSVLAMLKATPRDVFVAAFTGMFEFAAADALAKYDGPKLALVTASNDDATSLHNLPPSFDHEVMTGVGHWLMLDVPDAFAARLDAFIAGNVSVKGSP